MKIVIKYCRVCDYLPIAARLGLDIRNEFGLDVEYKAAGSGVFDLFCDDVLVYSKSGAGDKFPGKGEAVSLLKKEIEKRK